MGGGGGVATRDTEPYIGDFDFVKILDAFGNPDVFPHFFENGDSQVFPVAKPTWAHHHRRAGGGSE